MDADGVANTCTSRPSSATAMPPSGRQHSAVMARSKRLTSTVAAVPSSRRMAAPSAMIERLAVGREILGRVELSDRLGVFQDLVGLQRAVKGRHGDGGVAAPQKAFGKAFQRGDHLLFPQRRSYWTKSGSAPVSLYRPMRLLAMPPR